MIKRNFAAPAVFLVVALLLAPGLASAAKPFERLVIFGDSLSDPGNAFHLTGIALKPPYSTLDQFLVPNAPYARGGNHFSNGKTWVEWFAEKLDLQESAGPAFKGENEDELKMTNYAVGGARARDFGQGVNLASQLGMFQADAQGQVADRALYVLALGGNDVRDAVSALAQDSSGLLSAEIIANALSAISDAVIALYSGGATTLMVANVPDISITPAVNRLDAILPGAVISAAILSAKYNSELAGLLDVLEQSSPGLKIIRIDFAGSTRRMVDDPEAFQMTNMEDACVMPDQQPSSCKQPNRYLFWDGIHPTAKAHRVIGGMAFKSYQSFMRASEVYCHPGRKQRDVACRSVLWL
ncbi:MAG: SGNH/GDSL hydrolase family protein [Candidatus Thiodiazotropha lotti]|nr:SGNH/GDSL hydrolase family protein [Candidatus Thiodiazotropha lotti]MCG7998720.1 SGNH/GDSL hydrolase family protein [Candidatus Thiodiazotropha lotti]MCW4183873.1 SGNH/GDSL hydrolase family protein [Candidatus Thiodiazotropha weberae]MCW4190486.1 SGNH/GDSL hydrolase family protein [Candidatus Thiodiazotropha weberae]